MNSQGKVRCDSLESYLLGELDGAAMRSFERHLSGCADCQKNLDLLWPTHDLLAYEEPEQMDVKWAAAIKDRVLAEVLGNQPQRVEESESGHTAEAADRTDAGNLLRTHTVRKRRTPFRLSVYTVSVATLLVGFVLGSFFAGGWRRPGATVAVTQVLADVSMRPTVDAPLANGNVVLLGTQKGQEIIVTVHGLRPLPSSQCYNVWLISGANERILAGMITVSGTGTGALSAMVPTDLAFHYVGITLEPHLNDFVPKGPKVLGAPLTMS